MNSSQLNIWARPCFGAFWKPWKVVFWVCYGVLTPSWGPKYPQGPQMDWYPWVHVLPRQLTEIQILFVNLVHFFLFSHIVSIFGAIFGHFWPPTVPQTGPKVPIWTLTPKYITWVWNQPKSGPWLLILFSFSIFSPLRSFSAILGLWGGL